VPEPGSARAGGRGGPVGHWENLNQKRRWLAATRCNPEPRLRSLLGSRRGPGVLPLIPKGLGITGPNDRPYSSPEELEYQLPFGLT